MAIDHDHENEIERAREQRNSTRRLTVPEIEDILYQIFPVLDHGFLRVIDYMGGDPAVVQAARVSYGIGTRKVREDAALIKYLIRNAHSTPFEMAEIKFHVKLPIFVARQWVRHRTASINEYSARYSVLDKEFYVPEPEHLGVQSSTNRQGRAGNISLEQAAEIIKLLKEDAERCYDHYAHLLNESDGHVLDDGRPRLARELARINLTLGTYTQWYWKIDAHNLMHFLRLRADKHAQYEIRVYANLILEIFKRWMPATYAAFLDFRINSVTLSTRAFSVIRKILKGERVTQENSGLSKGEWQELQELLNAPG